MAHDADTIAISHLIDDSELVRTHALRTLIRQVELLTDGLHAIGNGSPAVAEEMMGRIRDSLDAEIAFLRSNSPFTPPNRAS